MNQSITDKIGGKWEGGTPWSGTETCRESEMPVKRRGMVDRLEGHWGVSVPQQHPSGQIRTFRHRIKPVGGFQLAGSVELSSDGHIRVTWELTHTCAQSSSRPFKSEDWGKGPGILMCKGSTAQAGCASPSQISLGLWLWGWKHLLLKGWEFQESEGSQIPEPVNLGSSFLPGQRLSTPWFHAHFLTLPSSISAQNTSLLCELSAFRWVWNIYTCMDYAPMSRMGGFLCFSHFA